MNRSQSQRLERLQLIKLKDSFMRISARMRQQRSESLSARVDYARMLLGVLTITELRRFIFLHIQRRSRRTIKLLGSLIRRIILSLLTSCFLVADSILGYAREIGRASCRERV